MKVKMLSPEEAARRAAIEKEALLCSMPEDAEMGQATDQSPRGQRNSGDQKHLLSTHELEISAENWQTSATSQDESFDNAKQDRAFSQRYNH